MPEDALILAEFTEPEILRIGGPEVIVVLSLLATLSGGTRKRVTSSLGLSRRHVGSTSSLRSAGVRYHTGAGFCDR